MNDRRGHGRGRWRRSMIRRGVLITAAAVSAVVAGIAVAHLFARNRLPRIPARHSPQVVVNWRQYSSFQAPTTGGPAVSIVVFGDYMCPACKVVWADLRELSERWTQLNYSWRHYPVLGQSSLSAAAAAECGRRAGLYDIIHEQLLKQDAKQIDSESFWLELPRDPRMSDTAGYTKCLRTSPADLIRPDLEHARQLGISIAPAVLIDSLLFRGSPGRRYLEAYIRKVGMQP